MRCLILLCLLIILGTMKLAAQAPKGINYQGVARDHDGKSIASKKIAVRISILKNGGDGTVEYKETHEVTTNAFGLFTLVIGQGTVNTGSFDFISWAVGSKWLQIELDPNGGNSFQLIGSQQLMSVPYALYAQYSGNGLIAGQGVAITNGVVNNTGDNDNSATNELNTSVTFGADHKLKITDAGGTKEADLSSLLGAPQNLSSTLTAGNDAGGQKITNLAAPVLQADAATKAYVDSHTDGDASSTNEIQDLTLTGNNLKITNNTSATSVSLAGYLDNTDNQDLTLSGNMLSLTNDVSPVNLSAYAQTLSVQSIDADTRSLTISGGNSVSIEVGDNDNSSTNEIQNINQVLTQNNDAGGLKLTNLGAPTAATDATTKLYVDAADAVLQAQISTTYAFKTTFDYTNTSGLLQNNVTMPFAPTTGDFDDFNVLIGNTFTASKGGTYVFIIEGSLNLPFAGERISLLVNSVKYPINILMPFGVTTPKFSGTLMFKLTAGQSVNLIGDNISLLSGFTGRFFGYKL